MQGEVMDVISSIAETDYEKQLQFSLVNDQRMREAEYTWYKINKFLSMWKGLWRDKSVYDQK
jgi:hypothetical protein